MEHKLLTYLHYFKYNQQVQVGPIKIAWFLYDLNPDLEENIRGFTMQELNLFESFVVPRQINFGGAKNYHNANEEELPVEIMDDLVPNERISAPTCLILKPNPEIERSNKVANFMPILLLNEKGEPDHHYNLPFGAIGKIVTD